MNERDELVLLRARLRESAKREARAEASAYLNSLADQADGWIKHIRVHDDITNMLTRYRNGEIN